MGTKLTVDRRPRTTVFPFVWDIREDGVGIGEIILYLDSMTGRPTWKSVSFEGETIEETEAAEVEHSEKSPYESYSAKQASDVVKTKKGVM